MVRRNVTVPVVIALALFASAIAGCGGDDDDSGSATIETADTGPRTGGTIIRRLDSECKTLNWVLYTTSYEFSVLRHLYDPIIDFDENLELIPVLAESFEVSDDMLRITVKLRDNIYWHDGQPITTADIKFTLDMILDPQIPALNKAGFFNKLDYLDVVDERTAIFVWKEAYAPSLYSLALLWPIPKHIYGEGDFLTHPANRAPVGSGPFKFAEWRTSQYIRLVRHDGYHGKKAYVDGIIFKVIENDAVALNALRTGELDEMRTTQTQWERQLNDADFEKMFNKYDYYLPSYNYIGWNCRTVWFKDSRVRLAMTMLFDRESINAKIYSGNARLVSGPFYINSWAYDRTIKPHPFSPSRARELLDAAGWVDSDGNGVRDKDGQEFEFELVIVAGGNTAKQFAQLLQEECKLSGIVVKIRQLEGATFFDRIDSGDFEACILAWRLDLDPDIFDTFHSSQIPPVGLNHGFYSNARVDSLLEAGRTTFDQAERIRIYHQIHQAMYEDPPYTFINAVPEKRPINKRIKGVIISPNGPFDFTPGANYWYIDETNGRVASEN